MTKQRKYYIDRFFDKIAPPPDINFELNFGDVISKDGIIQIVTGWGIYDNQMWTEKTRDSVCNLGEGLYEIVEKTMKISDLKVIANAKRAYKKAMVECFNKFLSVHYKSKKLLNQHLAQF